MLERDNSLSLEEIQEERNYRFEHPTKYDLLENKMIDAIMASDFITIKRILNTTCRHPHLRYRVMRFQPSPSCLSEAIYQRLDVLVKRFLAPPYFVVPSEDCLTYAVRAQRRDWIRMFMRRYRIEPNESTLRYAVTACNIKMVKYLLENPSIGLDEDLYEEIFDTPQEYDPFSVEVRVARNRIIRKLIRRAIRDG